MSSTYDELPEGACAVCDMTAFMRCSSCHREFYCGKEHQREDWPRHKDHCKAYEVLESPELGRHLVARRDLKPDEIIFSEAPIVWGPTAHLNDRVCVGCGKLGAYVARCPGCAWPACRHACDGLVDEAIHGFECKVLAAAKLLPRCDFLLALRCLMMRNKQPKRWRQLMKLSSHLESRGPGSEAHEETQKAIEYLRPFLQIDSELEKLLPQVCGIIDVNGLETNPPDGSMAIYEAACLLEHDCLPNTRLTFDPDTRGVPRINVIAVRDIKKGEHLSTSYTHVLWSTRMRREHLLSTKYFTCKCKRCADPTELDSHVGTLKCPCGKGYVTPDHPLKPDSDWSCKQCPGLLSAGEVAQLTDRLGEEVEAAMSVPQKDIMTDLLMRLMVLLHPCHQHCLTIGHSMLQMLDPADPKKLELCERLLQTFDKVDPHGARLGVYYAIALRELATCPGQDKSQLLRRAIHYLRYEPKGTSGYVLREVCEADVSA
ncbi:protein msta-like [Trichogramma pretiosum]|uniref:protein msta-like n=1 Tax=Trichogramma pretiosum TaxID=7493 RepID=UPI0006C95E3C|nr:protein msta-like [Trichogramma pretiosum]